MTIHINARYGELYHVTQENKLIVEIHADGWMTIGQPDSHNFPDMKEFKWDETPLDKRLIKLVKYTYRDKLLYAVVPANFMLEGVLHTDRHVIGRGMTQWAEIANMIKQDIQENLFEDPLFELPPIMYTKEQVAAILNVEIHKFAEKHGVISNERK